MVAQLAELNGTDPGIDNPLADIPHHEEWIFADALEIPYEYQGFIVDSWVNQIAGELDVFMLDPLYVSRRKNGRQVVMDGKHRLLAIRKIGWGDQKVQCLVWEGLTLEQEAKRFNTQNARRKMTPPERFRAALIEGRLEETTIDKVVRQVGYRVNLENKGRSGGRIVAIVQLQTIYRKYNTAGGLETVLRLIADAYGTDEGPDKDVLVGFAKFNRQYADEYEPDRLVQALKRTTLEELVRQGSTLAPLARKGVADGIARAMRDMYNYRRPERNQLPEWGTKRPRRP